jgi:hypothetical protein
MRSIVTLLLVAAFGISVGCGGDTPAKKTDAPKTDAPKTETPAEPAK